VLSLAECHKEILSQVEKCVCRGNVQILFIPTDCYKILLCLWRQCAVVGLAEYHKIFTSPVEKYLQRDCPAGVLTYFCRGNE